MHFLLHYQPIVHWVKSEKHWAKIEKHLVMEEDAAAPVVSVLGELLL